MDYYGFNRYTPNYNYNQVQQPAQDERIWVANRNAAEAYLVAPNGFVRLWDSSQPVFYEKRADATGRLYPIEMYKYEKYAPQSPQNSFSDGDGSVDYLKEIKALNKRITALEKAWNGGDEDAESNSDDTDV